MLGIEKEETVLFLSRIYFSRSRDDFRDPLESSIREEKLKRRVSSKRAVRRTNARIQRADKKFRRKTCTNGWIGRLN